MLKLTRAGWNDHYLCLLKTSKIVLSALVSQNSQNSIHSFRFVKSTRMRLISFDSGSEFDSWHTSHFTNFLTTVLFFVNNLISSSVLTRFLTITFSFLNSKYIIAMPFDEFFGGCISRDFDGRIAISRAILKIAFSAKVEMLNNVFFCRWIW